MSATLVFNARERKKMKKRTICFALILMMLIPLIPVMPVVTVSAAPLAFSEEERNINFNDDWKFYLASRSPSAASNGFASGGLADPTGAISTANCISTTYNDNNSSWRTLSVPHDFSIEGPKASGGGVRKVISRAV